MIDRERLVADALAAVSIPSFTGSEEAMAAWYAGQCEELGLAVQWQQVEDGRANVLATRAGTGGGPTLMFNGHMDTSYSGREPWLAGIPGLPARGLRARRADLRARDLEHEGRARRLSGGRAGARRRGAEGRRDARGGRGRDREDAAGRRAGGGVPRLCGRLPASRRARRRGRHVHPRRADGAEARARAFRHALAAALDVRPVHPHGLLVRAARGELDRAHARRARARARVAARVGGGDVVRRRPWRRERRCDPGRLRLARLADAAPHRPLPRPARAARRRDGGGPAEGARVRARARGRRGGGVRDRAGRRDRRVASARGCARGRARGGLRRRRPSGT